MSEPARRVMRYTESLRGEKSGWFGMTRSSRAKDFSFVWPSGQGEEIGTVSLTIEAAWDQAKANAMMASGNFEMFEVVEDDMTAILIKGLARTPISLVDENVEGLDVLSVIIDAEADVESVAVELESLFERHFCLSSVSA